jgi:Dickkopf N-terminal cysteine-rich region
MLGKGSLLCGPLGATVTPTVTPKPSKAPTKPPTKKPTAPTCKAVGAKCTSRTQCCRPSKTTCDGLRASSRVCKGCKVRRATCARSSECCLGLTCKSSRCL